MALGAPRSAVLHREPSRRGQRYRRRGGHSGSRRRLHSPHCQQQCRNQCDPVSEPEFQFHSRHGADRQHRPRAQLMPGNPSLPVKSVPEFIAYAKAHPGKIAMGSGGNGSPAHVIGEYFKLMTGTGLTHVPYRGAAPAVTDLLGGQIQVAFTELATSLGHIKSGNLRALAVTTSARTEALPDIPTLSEFIPGFEASQWVGLVAPKDTPSAIIEKLNVEINAALADPK